MMRESVAGLLGESLVSWERIRSGDHTVVHRARTVAGAVVYVKQGPEVAAERDRLAWLATRVAVPQVLAWSDGYLITSELPGNDLTHRLACPETVVRLLAGALRGLHAVDAQDCPFGDPKPGAVLTHGDACLPNFVTSADRFTGYLDVGAAGLADRDVDLAAALWSLHFNFGDDRHARAFVNAYGLPELTDKDLVRLRESY
ncbi:phosphotransferase [Nonomuraea sp. NPDC050556]|uniref:phosphotransferase n=1 Tax=Nonomuraea sp. NPDC050556 TaxID=3364369 RepID=UPI00379952E6